MHFQVYMPADGTEHIFIDKQTRNKTMATFSAIINEDIRCGWCL